MIEASGARHEILHRDPHAYSAHAHIIRLAGAERLVVFNKTIRRRLILHPPQDPEFRNWMMRSADGGASWSRFGAGLPAVRTTGLYVTEDGAVLRAATYGRGIWEINP